MNLKNLNEKQKDTAVFMGCIFFGAILFVIILFLN